jgi:hypothetical protein
MAIGLNLKGLTDLIKKPTASAAGGVSEPESKTEPSPAESTQNQKQPTKPKPALSDKLSGEAARFVADLKPFLPSELVGGSLPYVPGTEDEAVWNAAAQACSTEKVHYLYSIDGNKIWYLACSSSMLASNPDSWCPLAAALPGNSEFWDKETVYLYEQEGLASALRWDPETARMQIYLGPARSILPRIQSMDANFVTVNPRVADVVPWKNRQLRTEQLARASARMLLVAGILLNLGLLASMAVQYIAINFIDRQLEKVKADTETASTDLMIQALQASQNDVSRHLVRVQRLLDDLEKIDGTLVRYQVKSGKLEWEALVPAAYSTGVMSVKGVAQPGIEKDGRIRIKGTT